MQEVEGDLGGTGGGEVDFLHEGAGTGEPSDGVDGGIEDFVGGEDVVGGGRQRRGDVLAELVSLADHHAGLDGGLAGGVGGEEDDVGIGDGVAVFVGDFGGDAATIAADDDAHACALHGAAIV